MEILPHSYRYTSHPTDRPWDQVLDTKNVGLSKKAKDLIKELAPIDVNKLPNDQPQQTYLANKQNISTYSPEYQQFARKAGKSMLNKKHGYSVDKNLSKSEEIETSEADHNHLDQDIRTLEKLHGDIISGKREYIAKGEEKFEQFEYPDNNNFKNIKKEEKDLAKQKQDEYLAVNTNIQLSLQQGLERMNTSLTTTEEFKSIKNLVDQGNLKEDREELSNFIESLYAYLQGCSSKNAALQKKHVREYLEENRWVVAKQISKANQRFKEAKDYTKTAEERLTNHRKIAKNYEKSVIHDTYVQAMKRAKQTRERAKNAERQYKEADERAKQAVKRIEQAKKFSMKDAIKAAEESLCCAKEVARLAQKLADDERKLAEDIERWAKKLKSNPLSHNSEEEKNILEKEEKFINDSKKAINDIIHKQKEESNILEKEIDILKEQKCKDISQQYQYVNTKQDVNAKFLSESQSKRIDKLKKCLVAIENKAENNETFIETTKKRIEEEINNIITEVMKNTEEVKTENSIFKREKEKEILNYNDSTIAQIGKSIETIGKSKEIFEKQEKIYSQIALYHKSLASSHPTINQADTSSERYVIQAEQAQIRSELHEIRKKQAEDRHKQYYKRELQLADQHIDSQAVQQAALHANKIIQLEYALQNAEYSLATYAKQAAESIEKVQYIENKRKAINEKEDKFDHDKLSDMEKTLAEAKKNLSDAEANIAKWTKERDKFLSKIQEAYKQESTAIEQEHVNAKDTFNTAKEDLENLVNLRKHLDVQQEKSANSSNDLIEKSCKSLERNLWYMEYKSNHDLKEAIDMINTIDIHSINKQAQEIINGSEAQIPLCNSLDGEKWLFTTSGLCMNIRELRNIKVDPETKQTQIQWREDATKLTIFGSKKFAKRISSFHLDTDTRTLTFETPGTHYKRGLGENERSVWKVTNNGKEEVYNADELDGIEVMHHKHDRGKDEISVQTTIRTLPKNTVNPDDLFDGYSRLHLQTMNRFNTNSGEFIGPNNKFRKPILHFDFTETVNAPGVGLLFHEGETNRSIHPDSIVKVDRMLSDANKIEEETNAKIIEYAKYSKNILRDAIESQSREKIQQVMKILEQNDALAASENAAMNYRLQNAPKDVDEVMKLKETSRTYLKELAYRQHENAKELFESRNTFNNRLKLWIEHANNEKTVMISKEQALEAINATYRLKKHNFQLLVDPNRDGEVKCSNPDSLMLIEEWETYANKDLSEQEKDYHQRLENFIMENCHSYWKNYMSVIKAANYAAKGDDQLNNAIKSLKEGLSLESGPLDPSYTADLGDTGKKIFGFLNASRRSDEQELVRYLHKAFSQARTEGVDQLLYGYLSIAKHIQQSKLQALKIARYALSPSVSSKDALQSLEAMPKDELPISTYQEREKPTKLQQIEDEMAALAQKIPYSIPEEKSPQEFAMHVSTNLHKYAVLLHKYNIELADNTHLKQSLEQHSEEQIKYIHQNLMKLHELEFKKRENREFEDIRQRYRKEMMQKQLRMNIIYALLLPLQQSIQALNNSTTTAGTALYRAILTVTK